MRNVSKTIILSFITILIFISQAFAENHSLPDFTKLVEDNSSSIVNISTVRKGAKKNNSDSAPQVPNDELNEFLKKFFGDRGFGSPDKNPPRNSQSMGSGFILSLIHI